MIMISKYLYIIYNIYYYVQNLLFNEALFVDDGGEGCPEHNGHSLEIIQDQQCDESLISEARIPTIIVIGCHL